MTSVDGENSHDGSSLFSAPPPQPSTAESLETNDKPHKPHGGDTGAAQSRWKSSVVKKKPPRGHSNRFAPRRHRQHLVSPQSPRHNEQEEEHQQRLGEALRDIPQPRVMNLTFPASNLFPAQERMFLLDEASPLMDPLSSEFGNTSSSEHVDIFRGTAPQDALLDSMSAAARDKWMFRQSGRHKPRAEARIVHPQGFRILKGRSAVERSLRSYFRLPPAPSAHLQHERRQTQRQLMAVETAEDEEEIRFFGAAGDGLLPQPCMLLDGFLLLCAGGQPEPEAVETVTLQCSHLVGVIEDDLTHFQNLRFLDLSENELLLEHLLSISSLEVLHLAYNKITSLAGIVRAVRERQLLSGDTNRCAPGRGGSSDVARITVRDSASIRSAAAYYAQGTKCEASLTNDSVQRHTPTGVDKYGSSDDCKLDGAGYFSPHQKALSHPYQTSECSLHDVLLPNLHVLNLSFNRIPSGDILHLSYFPFLEKLDLSGNNLRTLPEDLADLTSVTHLALERNSFRDSSAIFSALSTMPALVEVNLNHNELHQVPPLSVKNGRGLCFPSIEVIGLGYNRFATVRDVAALSELVRTLQRVVLTGNPIASKRKERSAAQSYFAQAVMNLYWEQANVRLNVAGESSRTGHFGFEPLRGNTPLPHTQEHCSGDVEDDEKEKAEEDYHEWGSFISLWRRQEHSLMSKNSTFSTGLRNSEEDENDDLSFDRPSSMTLKTGAVPTLTSGSTTINNIFWYGDAEQAPSHNMAATGHAHTVSGLPTPSVLRFMELVFDDVVMKKQKPGYFYEKKRQLAAVDAARPLSLVNSKTGLVTVPAYSEFMDIYHILENPPLSRRTFKGRQYATEREKRRTRGFKFAVPEEQDDAAKEEVETKEEGHSAAAGSAKMSGVQAGKDTNVSVCEDVSPEDVVFMTGVSFSETRGARPEKQGEEKRKQDGATEEPNGDTVGGISKEHISQSDTNAETRKEHVNGQTSRPRNNRHEHQEKSYPARKRRDMSSAPLEPPSTNVRILMNEIRRILRCPLPPLPSVSKGKSARGNASRL